MPQLYRRLLRENLPGLDFAADETPGVGALVPPIAGETWRSLFEKLVLTRRNTVWRPVATVIDEPSTSATGASVSNVPDEEINTAAPKLNNYMHMPLPDNYDTQTKQASLPAGFEWVELDPSKESDVKRLTAFLDANALQDTEEQFKLGWTVAHIERQLKYKVPPAKNAAEAKKLLKPLWAAVQTNGATGPKNLIAFIAAVPAHLRLWSKVEPFYMVRQLCVHRKMRGHRVARVIVKELSRRVHHLGNSQQECTPAFFTLGVPMPFKMLVNHGAYHRTFQHDRFTSAGLKPTIDRKDATTANYKMLENVRLLEPKDLVVVFPFVCTFLERFKVALAYTGAEFAHRYLPRPGCTYSYVHWDKTNTKPLGFFSFSELHYDMLALDSLVKQLRIAYTDIIFPVSNLDLAKSMLVAASEAGFDELEIGSNAEHQQLINQEDLHFKPGTGKAFHYIHNWICDDIEPKDWSLSENN